MGSGTSIGHYLRTCMRSNTSQAAPLPVAGTWPIPPAYPWAAGLPPASGRRRQRWFRFWAAAFWTNLMLVTLSYLHLGEKRVCPPAGRTGMPLTASQRAIAQRVHGLAVLMCRPPYLTGGRGQMKLRALLEYLREIAPTPAGAKVAPPQALSVKEFQASRAKFLKRPLHFDPTPWLSIFSAATYIEPDLLRPRTGGGSDFWEDQPPAQRGEDSELLSFVREWDRFGKLYLAPASEVPLTDRHQLLPVPKDETTDRIVHDRRPRNAKEVPLAGRSKVFCSGHSLVDFQLGPPGPGADQLRATSDDLEDYYPGRPISTN